MKWPNSNQFPPQADAEEQVLLRYVYGGISRQEITAAVSWEYGRMNQTLLYWSRVLKRSRLLKCFKGGREREGPMSGEELLLRLTARDIGNAGVVHRRTGRRQAPLEMFGSEWRSIWMSNSFPEKRWVELERAERDEICFDFANIEKQEKPLPVADVRLLEGMEVLDKWLGQAVSTPLGQKFGSVPARLQNQEYEHVVFTIRYSDGVDAVRCAFARWLDLPDQRSLFDRYKKRQSGKDLPVQRLPQALRDLALRQVRDKLGGPIAAEKWLSWVRVTEKGEARDRPAGKRKDIVTVRNIADAVRNSEDFEAELFKTF